MEDKSPSKQARLEFEEFEERRAFDNTLRYTKWLPRGQRSLDIEKALDGFKGKFESFINGLLHQFECIKLWMNFDVEYEKLSNPEIRTKAFFRIESTVITNVSNLENEYEKFSDQIKQRNEHFINEGSGFRIGDINGISLHAASHNPLRHVRIQKKVKRPVKKGGTYKRFPEIIEKRKSVQNLKNKDNCCFAYSILAAIYPGIARKDNPGRLRLFFDQYGFDQLDYPVDILKFDEYEKFLGIGFNVFTLGDDLGKIQYRLFSTKIEDPMCAINLLYFEGHFGWIYNVDRFFWSDEDNKHHPYVCLRCLTRCYSKIALDRHVENCVSENDYPRQVIMLPAPGDKDWQIKFKNISYQQRFPFDLVTEVFDSVGKHLYRDDRVGFFPAGQQADHQKKPGQNHHPFF